MSVQRNDLSKSTGFFYMIFEPYSTSYARCWLDGEDDCHIYSKEDLISLANSTEPSPTVTLAIKQAFQLYSVFLWDVDERKITQLRASSFEDEPEIKKFHPLSDYQPFNEFNDYNVFKADYVKGRYSIDSRYSFLGENFKKN